MLNHTILGNPNITTSNAAGEKAERRSNKHSNSDLSASLKPAGWDNWRNPTNELTARFSEFNSTGPGGSAAARVPWAKQLTAAEVARYTVENVLGGADSWNPVSGATDR